MRLRKPNDSRYKGSVGVSMVVPVWLIGGILLRALIAQAEVQDCVWQEEKIICTRVECRMRDGTTTCTRTPVTPGQSTPSPMSTPQGSHEQIFHGRVVNILQKDTLVVDSQGTIRQVRIKTAWPWAPDDLSHEDLAAVSLHQDITVSVHKTDAQGVLFATVLLSNGRDLGTALWQHHMQKPDVRAQARQRAEAEARADAQERVKAEAKTAKPSMPLFPKSSAYYEANERAREEAVALVIDGIRQRVLPQDYKQRVDAALMRLLKDPTRARCVIRQRPMGV